MSMSMLEKRLWGVSVAWQKFFNTGLLGAIITIVASAWQLVASAFHRLLVNPFTYIFLRICLFLEATGLLWGLGSRLDQQDDCWLPAR
jgi:fluoride ion exporter CrcB/FEX